MPTRTAKTATAKDMLMNRLYSEHCIRAVVNRYMRLCDELGPGTSLDELLALFTDDAVWEGRGHRYQAAFGRLVGRTAIGDMFRGYTAAPAHFEMNAHFLCSEHIEVNADNATAQASWMMLQPSTLSTGKSRLSAARLQLTLVRSDDAWRIAHFSTTNLFNRAVDQWNDQGDYQVPPQINA